MRWIPLLAVALAPSLLIAASCRQAPAPQYVLRVAFNERYTDAAGRAVEDAVHRYDPHATVLLQETFPPIAVATFRSRDTRACADLIAELKPRPDVASADCYPRDY